MEISKKIIIYYFSGTGNAESVCQWIKEAALGKKYSVEIINIARLEKRKIEDIPKEALIGFCSPTHGFNFPPIMLHFIMRFPKGQKNKAFIINTRAGMKFGKMFVAGLSGVALLLAAILLKMKGYAIIGLRSIDLPSNWISLHPGLSEKTVEAIFIKRKEDTLDFAKKILSGKKGFIAFKDIIQDIAIAPISVLYYFIGRFVFAKSFIASNDCSHCDLCLKKCPVDAIKKIDNRYYWTHKCESCMQCMNNCPKRAIETAHGFIIGFSILFYSAILFNIYALFNYEAFLKVYIHTYPASLIVKIINSAMFILFLVFSYRITHYLLRFKFFERIIVYTSLTKYSFWRRYKVSRKLKDM